MGEHKPNTPRQVHRRTWRYVLRRTVTEFIRNDCANLAAALTYYSVLSIFPALLAVVSLLGMFGNADAAIDAVLDALRVHGSTSAAQAIESPLRQLAAAPGAGFSFAGGLAGALWTTSRYTAGFGKALNRIYQTEEGRPFWKLRPMMLLITVIMLITASVMVALLVVSGPVVAVVGEAIGLKDATVVAFSILKWPLLVLLAVLLIALLYYATPNVKQPRFRWMSFGSLIALTVLVISSGGFFFYVANFSNYNTVYGSIGGVIVLLLWLYIVNLVLLFGGQFDAEFQRGRQLQAGIVAESLIQVDVRDTRQIIRRHDQQLRDVALGRELRKTGSHDSRE